MGAVVCVGRLQTVCVGKKAAAACVHIPSLAFQHPCAKEEGHSGKAMLGVTVTKEEGHSGKATLGVTVTKEEGHSGKATLGVTVTKEEGHRGKATLGVTITQPKDDDTLHSNSHDAERDHIDNDMLYVDFRSHGLTASVFVYSWYTSGRLPHARRHFSKPKIQEGRLLI